MLEDAFSLAVRWGMLASDERKEKKKKDFLKRGLTVVLMEFLPFQETHSHPLLKPLLKDPKMGLKTSLLSLRFRPVNCIHQSVEVNIFTMKKLSLHRFSIRFWIVWDLNITRNICCKKDYLSMLLLDI